MHNLQEEQCSGRDYLSSVTSLLQRVRMSHPTLGLFEAADLQWWWAIPRATDDLDQLFWLDAEGQPHAAVILTDWRGRTTMDPLVLPEAHPDLVAHVVSHGLNNAAAAGIGEVELEVDRTDDVLRGVLEAHGFTCKEEGFVEAWLPAAAIPPVSSLHEGYRLASRAESPDRPHYLTSRGPANVAERLLEASLYRPEFDLEILDADDQHVAHGIFWNDPATATGMVEPMRTEQAHQRRGLARHVLTSGLALLADAGAERIKICFEPDNPASSQLYLDVGFEPVKHTDLFSGPTKI